MKLSFITIMVRDIEKTIAFYEQIIGMEVKRRFNPAQGEIVFMGHAGDSIMLEFIEFAEYEKVKTSGLVMSYTSDRPLEEKRQQLLESGYFPSKIIDNSPKPKHFNVKDPDDICVEFTE